MRASEVAYQRLRDEIIQWHLQPGMPLGEIETAQRMGVSRTPIREALSRLAAEGLVSSGAGRTMIVAPLSPATIRHLYEYREALETQAARLAARRRAVQFVAGFRARNGRAERDRRHRARAIDRAFPGPRLGVGQEVQLHQLTGRVAPEVTGVLRTHGDRLQRSEKQGETADGAPARPGASK